MKNDLSELDATAVRCSDAFFAAVSAPRAGTLSLISDDGSLIVETSEGQVLCCDVLLGPAENATVLERGDRVIVAVIAGTDRPIVLGRIGRYALPQPQTHLTLEATESLTLKCGQAQVDLRADGKVMIKGEDVLLRAKGTQRIRAGTVAIN